MKPDISVNYFLKSHPSDELFYYKVSYVWVMLPTY